MDNINHFSYSMAKNIYRKGIDYAVALKLGVIEKTYEQSFRFRNFSTRSFTWRKTGIRS